MKIGYKATYDFICRGYQFEIGQTYELPNKPIICQYGFHYCVKPKDVLVYYSIRHNFRLLEIEDLGESIVKEDKSVTNKIRIIREVPKEEYYQLFGVFNNELTITDKSGYCGKYKFDERNNQIYSQDLFGNWDEREYDERNNCVYIKSSNGYHTKQTYDENNNLIYYETSTGFWRKYSYGENNTLISFKDSDGTDISY
jgi:hypothetical protein